MFNPRHPLISVPAFSSPDLCVPVFSSLSSFCSGGSSDPCSSPILDSFDEAIPFRITSFADPHPLTPIESHLCKKQGRGWGRCQRFHPTQTLPLFSTASKHPIRRNSRKPSHSIGLLTFLCTPRDGGGTTISGCLPPGFSIHTSRVTGHGSHLLCSARLCGLCASALSFSPLFHSTFNCRLSTSPLPQNFYPPAPKLRHNPAAQGHHPQSNLRTGRNQ